MQLSSSELQQHAIEGKAVNEWRLAVTIKHAILYSAAVILLSATLSYFYSAIEQKETHSVTGMYIFAIVFWAMGLAHIFIFHPLTPLLPTQKGLTFSSVLALFICGAVWLIFTITSLDAKQLCLAAGISFLLPHLLQQLLRYYFSIPPKVATGWIIPAGARPDTRKSLLLNSLHFKVRIKINPDDVTAHSFTVNLSEKLTLGNMFLRFLHDQDDQILITDVDQQPFAWQFSVKNKLGFITTLDPDKTLKENNLQEGAELLIVRQS